MIEACSPRGPQKKPRRLTAGSNRPMKSPGTERARERTLGLIDADGTEFSRPWQNHSSPIISSRQHPRQRARADAAANPFRLGRCCVDDPPLASEAGGPSLLPLPPRANRGNAPIAFPVLPSVRGETKRPGRSRLTNPWSRSALRLVGDVDHDADDGGSSFGGVP